MIMSQVTKADYYTAESEAMLQAFGDCKQGARMRWKGV